MSAKSIGLSNSNGAFETPYITDIGPSDVTKVIEGHNWPVTHAIYVPQDRMQWQTFAKRATEPN